MDPEIVRLAQRVQALARTGLTFATDRYDLERYEELEGIAARLMTLGDPEREGEALRLFRGEVGYATPKVDVRGVVVRDGRVLLLREPGDGLWSLPGGWADVGDRPSRAVEREVFEETGLEVRVERLLGVWDRNLHGHPPYPFHVYKLLFHCVEVGGAPRPGVDALEVGFFDPEDLPPLSLSRVVPPVLRQAVQAVLTGAPAWFD